MISFYPGPSRIHDKVSDWVRQAQKKGILSMNHRSAEFMRMSEETVVHLRKKLRIPKEYHVYFTNSATECWEMIAQSLILDKSIHIYNGAFGEKWHLYTRRLKPEALAMPYGPEQELDPASMIFNEGDLICLTQNETSNGTSVSNKIIARVRLNNPKHLIAVDATSSMAGVYLDFSAADVWFASVQKCFGLPAGLGIMICSPRAVARIHEVNERNHYNSLTAIDEMMQKWQTVCTPNVLGIYLLGRAARAMKKISVTETKLRKRQARWVRVFRSSKNLSLLIQNPSVQSRTVIAVSGDEHLIALVKRKARRRGLLLGEGYGSLQATSFRIANFPALHKKEITKLEKFLTTYL
ncbi:MAG: aminotransferase class V-fold PLP-dependent enzyme [Cyclobacteriaceae bacterium]|nr:aminotransferase class V-fold PLP-dependent enzyme [Cyclobacteriaceae bacterium]